MINDYKLEYFIQISKITAYSRIVIEIKTLKLSKSTFIELNVTVCQTKYISLHKLARTICVFILFI